VKGPNNRPINIPLVIGMTPQELMGVGVLSLSQGIHFGSHAISQVLKLKVFTFSQFF
jgi:hypothetical protein